VVVIRPCPPVAIVGRTIQHEETTAGIGLVSMISSKQLLHEVVSSLRNVIAPAIAEPYPKAQAYMAAVILEFVSRQVDERADISAGKQAELASMFRKISQLTGMDRIAGVEAPSEAGLCHLIERLYAERDRLGEETFTVANRLVRETLRHLLDQELKVAGKAEG
jgi:hypothetical protein